MRLLPITTTALGSLLIGACGGGGSTPVAAPAPNKPPAFVGSATTSVRVTTTRFFSYDLSQRQTVVDPDGDPLSYSVRTCGCPPWLTVAGSRLSGTPPQPESFQIVFTVSDGRGGTADGVLHVSAMPNAAPAATLPNGPILVVAGSNVNYDASQAGTAFTDADGDPLSYQIEMLSPPLGLTVSGTRIIGSLSTVGAVSFKITAEDGYGGRGEYRFSFAVAGPEPGSPTLPATRYTYEDAKLPLPLSFQRSVSTRDPFWDTTPPGNRITDAGATLGRVLFYDKRLSSTNTHSCASCHEQSRGFASPDRVPTGVTGAPLKRNAMGLTNVRFNRVERWFADERAPSLEQLALMPIEDVNELGNGLPLLEAKLAATSFYPRLFTDAFGSPDVTANRIAKALAQFLRSLISYQSKFDAAHLENPAGHFVDPATVFTAQELRGKEVFQTVPRFICATCHSTDIQTSSRATNNGLDLDPPDVGAGLGTFRASSLRNVALTAPYMHDGRFATLRDVIEHYDHGMVFRTSDGSTDNPQLNIGAEDKVALEAFLLTLTDPIMVSDPRFSDPFR